MSNMDNFDKLCFCEKKLFEELSACIVKLMLMCRHLDKVNDPRVTEDES